MELTLPLTVPLDAQLLTAPKPPLFCQVPENVEVFWVVIVKLTVQPPEVVNCGTFGAFRLLVYVPSHPPRMFGYVGDAAVGEDELPLQPAARSDNQIKTARRMDRPYITVSRPTARRTSTAARGPFNGVA